MSTLSSGLLRYFGSDGIKCFWNVHSSPFNIQKADFLWSSTVFDFVKIRPAEAVKLVQMFAGTTKKIQIILGYF